MASRRPKAPSSCPFAAILSDGVPAESSAERALAMSPKTVCSCCAIPFTVATRLGIRSARRCNTMSTCDHEAFTASFLVTSVLRTPTYCPKATTAISARIAITIRTLTILPPESNIRRNGQTSPPWFICHLSLILLQHSIHCGGYVLNGRQVAGENVFGVELFAVRLVVADIQQLQERRRLERNAGRENLDGFALGMGSHVTQRQQRVPEQSRECRHRAQKQLPQGALVVSGLEQALPQQDQ